MGRRRVGDSDCWVLPLDVEGVDQSTIFGNLSASFDPNIGNGWQHRLTDSIPPSPTPDLYHNFIEVDFHYFENPVLQYSYVIPLSLRGTFDDFV